MFWLRIPPFYGTAHYRVHFFGKNQNRIIAWDFAESFLRKIQKIWKGINRGLNPAKETKNPKTDFSIYTDRNCFSVKTAYQLTTWTFFESFPKAKKHKSREFWESGFGLIHWIFITYGFIGFTIPFWILPKKQKIRIRIRIFPEECTPWRKLEASRLKNYRIVFQNTMSAIFIIFSKTAANFLEIGRKHVFIASNRNTV